MWRSMPPVRTASNFSSINPWQATWMAASEEAQAASVTKLGPVKLKTLATRPEMMLESSPGMVSSLMAGDLARMFLVKP